MFMWADIWWESRGVQLQLHRMSLAEGDAHACKNDTQETLSAGS